MKNKTAKPVAAGFFREALQNKALQRCLAVGLFAVLYGLSMWAYTADVFAAEPSDALAQTFARGHVAAPAAELPQIDINAAADYELALLPGVGEVLSARIVAYREENGAFTDPMQLLAVEGIGEGKLEAMAPYLLFP